MSFRVAVTSKSFSNDLLLREALLSKFPNVRFNETGRKLEGEELVEFLKDADRAIVALDRIDDWLLSKLPKLKLISKFGVGLDNISFPDLLKHDVLLAWKSGVNRQSVAELALHFILGTVHGSFCSHRKLQEDIWFQPRGFNLHGKTVGIIGLGHVGQELVKMLMPFSVKVMAFDVLEKEQFCFQYNVVQTNLQNLLKNSDVISIHLPLTSRTKNFINVECLRMMKDGVFLINTARGGIVDELALESFLISGKIAAAAFDVFMEEPFFDQRLKKRENFYYTSHIGGSTVESIQAMGMASIEGLFEGKKAESKNFFDYEV